jgi:thioredoxin 1
MAIELMDFYADWCGPCVVMKPVIEELEKELGDKLAVKKIDVDQESETASTHGVMSIPTYIIAKDGKEVDRIVGATSKETLRTKILQQAS